MKNKKRSGDEMEIVIKEKKEKKKEKEYVYCLDRNINHTNIQQAGRIRQAHRGKMEDYAVRAKMGCMDCR